MERPVSILSFIIIVTFLSYLFCFQYATVQTAESIKTGSTTKAESMNGTRSSIEPSLAPSNAPSREPSTVPSIKPSTLPSVGPSIEPSLAPSNSWNLHVISYGQLQQFAYHLPPIANGAQTLDIPVHASAIGSNRSLDGDIFAAYAHGTDGSLFKSAIVPKLDGNYVAHFPAFSFPPGSYTFEIRAEQFLDRKLFNQSYSFPSVLNTDAKEQWIASILENDINFRNPTHFPVCDDGRRDEIMIGSQRATQDFEKKVLVTRSKPSFRIEYYKDMASNSSFTNLGPCHISDFDSNRHPGMFFNSSECGRFSEFCCDNTIPSWNRMYRLHSCCLPVMQQEDLLQLKRKGKKILFAGDSTTNEVFQQGLQLWPDVFGSIVEYVWISDPFRNSLKWILDYKHSKTGRRFWTGAKNADFVVLHACAHEIAKPHKKSSTRKSPLSMYKSRLQSFVAMMKARAPGKHVLMLSCGAQTFQNIEVSSDTWKCMKHKNCSESDRRAEKENCQRFDLMNLGWGLDHIAREIVSNEESFSFLDLHTLGEVARADLRLFPHIESTAPLNSTSSSSSANNIHLSGDIHQPKGGFDPDFEGWLCQLRIQMVMNYIYQTMNTTM